MKNYICLILFLSLSLLLCAQPVAKVRVSENIKYEGHVLSNSANETWIFWDESVADGYEIHGQKYDSLGEAVFASHIAIITSEGSARFQDAVVSNDDGIVLLFMDEDDQWQISLKVQKLNSQGLRQWTDSGIYVGPVPNVKTQVSKLCANNLGGAFLVYPEYSDQNLVITKCSNYDAAGNNIWTANDEIGLEYSSAANQLLLTDTGALIINIHSWQGNYLRKVDNHGNTVGSYPMFAPDAVIPTDPQFQKAADGNILIYSAGYYNDNILKMQMLEPNGNLAYSAFKELPLSFGYLHDVAPQIEPLSDGGFIVAYVSLADSYYNPFELRVQRMNAALEPVWGSENPLILTGDLRIVDCDLKVDASYNAWISVLKKTPNFEKMQVEMVKLNPDGTPAFAPQLVSSFTRYVTLPRYSLFTDKAMLFWSDTVGDQIALRRQVFSASGDQLLAENGAAISSKLAGSASLYGVYNLADRTLFLMHDSRKQNQQIYFQILDNEMNQYLPENGKALDTSDNFRHSILATKVSPQNTLFIVYNKKYEYANHEKYVQEIDASGNLLYPGSGILLTSSNSSSFDAALGFADNSCYIYWTHTLVHNGLGVIKGQKIVSGAAVWQEGGSDIYYNVNKHVQAIDAQGRYLTFKCLNLTNHHNELRTLYIQPTGTIDPVWDPDGVSLINPDHWYITYRNIQTGMIQDDLYCLILTSDQYEGYSLRFQKLDASGNILWGNEGIIFSSFDGYYPGIILSIFADQISVLHRYMNQGIFLQRIDRWGNMGFTEQGIAMPTHNVAHLTQYDDGSYSYFWLDFHSFRESLLHHMYVNFDGSFEEGHLILAGSISNTSSVICENNTILCWEQNHTGNIAWEGDSISGIYARTIAGPIANADIVNEPMPMISLMQNSPNPFTGSTRISYKLREASPVKLQIFNIKGQLVRELPSMQKAAGEYSWDWDGADAHGKKCAGGIYLYKIDTGNHSASKKMILINQQTH